ncbi:MAG: hypothetical protein IKB88_10985 [Clostridia bacterium]|nr:hypothetical protein [Clostridia bacterium]
MKRILVLSVALLIVIFADVTAYSVDYEHYSQQFEASGASELNGYLDENTREYLGKLGVDPSDIDGMMSLSLGSLGEMLMNMLRVNLSAPLKGCLTACGAVMLVSVCGVFFPDNEKGKNTMNLICGCFVITSVMIPATDAVNAGVSAMKLCAGFGKALVPVLAAVLTASGNPASALSYQSVAFAAAQTVEAIAKNFALPLVYISGILGAVGAFLPTLRLSAVSDLIRKTATTVVGLTAAFFSGFLTLKNVISSSADGLAAKGIRLAASTFIPVVGGALSEAYSALSGSLSLLKGIVGIYGIIAVAVTVAPPVISLALWLLGMRAAAMMSDLLGNSQCSDIIRNISYMFSMLNAMLIFSAAVFIISSGIVASMKAGG